MKVPFLSLVLKPIKNSIYVRMFYRTKKFLNQIPTSIKTYDAVTYRCEIMQKFQNNVPPQVVSEPSSSRPNFRLYPFRLHGGESKQKKTTPYINLKTLP